MNFIPATKLSDRSYVGLVLSQFLAAFNDQAIHIVAIFFASDLLHGYVHLPGFDQKTIVSIVTACFIAPFFLFSPLAGILADKYSKQRTIVFWKIAEVFITGLALVGFLLPHTVGWGWADSKTIATISAFLVIAAVFLMGTHSAFFVPAKYGIMPEILHTSVLSRGNGILEGTSFVSNILGTSFGGYLYFFLKNRADPLAGGEWVIGLTLFALAWLGMAFAYLVAPIPAASPDRQFTLNPLVPLAKNFGELRRSKPLVLAVVGIAFFTFMTLFVRQTLLFQGESAKELHEARAHLAEMTPPASSSNNPVPPAGATPDAPAQTSTTLLPTPLVPPSAQPSQQLDELWIATLVALVGFGVGGGCALAGRLSGSRVELGLVLFGTLALALMTACLAVVAAPPIAPSGSSGLWQTLLQMAQSQAPTIICLVIIGLVSGLYIVPLYTLLQHRAPKDSKGNMVATSNFLNVTGGLIAVASFYCVTLLLQSWTGNSLTAGAVEESHDPAVWRAFVTQLEAQQSIPQRLFLTASGFTLLMFALMSWMRPDFLSRTLSYLLMPLRRRLEVDHADFVPSYGPLLVVSNASSLTEWLCIVSAIDRKLCFMWQPTAADQGMLATLVQATGIGRALPATSDDLPQFLEKSLVLADERELLWGVTAPGEAGTHSPASDWSRILSTLQDSLVKNQLADRWRILPVLARNFSPAPDRQSTIPAISVGHPLPVTATASEIAAVLGQLATH